MPALAFVTKEEQYPRLLKESLKASYDVVHKGKKMTQTHVVKPSPHCLSSCSCLLILVLVNLHSPEFGMYVH